MHKRSLSTNLTGKRPGPVSDEVKSLRSQIVMLLKENGALRRQLDSHREFPYEQLGLSSNLVEIHLESNAGMTKKEISLVEDALQDALMFKKNNLYEVADLVVSQMKYHTEEEGWMCHVSPTTVDIGFVYNLNITSTVCFSFGDGLMKYDARVTKVNQ